MCCQQNIGSIYFVISGNLRLTSLSGGVIVKLIIYLRHYDNHRKKLLARRLMLCMAICKCNIIYRTLKRDWISNGWPASNGETPTFAWAGFSAENVADMHLSARAEEAAEEAGTHATTCHSPLNLREYKKKHWFFNKHKHNSQLPTNDASSV